MTSKLTASQIAIIRNKTWPRDENGYLKSLPIPSGKKRHWTGFEWIIVDKRTAANTNRERTNRFFRRKPR